MLVTVCVGKLCAIMNGGAAKKMRMGLDAEPFSKEKISFGDVLLFPDLNRYNKTNRCVVGESDYNTPRVAGGR
jgi:hypothetical protein